VGGVLGVEVDVVEPGVARRVSLDGFHLGVLEGEHLLPRLTEVYAHLAAGGILQNAAEPPLGLGGHPDAVVSVQLHGSPGGTDVERLGCVSIVTLARAERKPKMRAGAPDRRDNWLRMLG
jgi:hypothetical protein